MEHLLSGVLRSVASNVTSYGAANCPTLSICGTMSTGSCGCHQPHPLRLISFQDAEPAVTFEGSQLDVFVALDTLFS